ncbi:MAG: hypothetical protein KKH40_05960, partial [Nanoarchaeota archaeon]|nr:hypothetical protein [Nanoarchaeota archaeon]
FSLKKPKQAKIKDFWSFSLKKPKQAKIKDFWSFSLKKPKQAKHLKKCVLGFDYLIKIETFKYTYLLVVTK